MVANEHHSDVRPANRHLLESNTTGGLSWRGRPLFGQTRPILAGLAVLCASYLVVAAIMISSGVVFMHVFAHGPVGRWDNHVNSWFAGHRSARWNRVTEDFTLLANTLGVVAVAALVTVVLWARRWGKAAMLVAIGLVIELAVFLPTTYLVARPRPSVQHVGGTPSTYSWPSGHTAATLTLYGGIAVLVALATRRRIPRVVAWLVAVSLTVCVALSRVYRGEHHPIDAMAGAMLGVGALCAAVLTVRTWISAGAQRPIRTPAPDDISEGVPESMVVHP